FSGVAVQIEYRRAGKTGNVPSNARQGRVRSRRQRQNIGRDLAEVRRRNDVVRESIAGKGTVRLFRGAGGIEDRLHRGEIALLEGRGRHGPATGKGAFASAVAFVAEKPEAPILAVIHLRQQDRAADGGAEAVLLVRRLQIAVSVVVVAVGVKVVVYQVFVRGAVQLIGAGLDVEVRNRSQASAVGRVQAAGLEAEFADCVHAGLELADGAGDVGAPDRDAFDVHLVRAGWR